MDHYRWLRSDGSPNFSEHVYKDFTELELLARRPAITVWPSSTILNALETMTKYYRSLLVARGPRLEGLLLSTHLVNYLGGGELHEIVARRHNYNIFSALEKEVVSSIMERRPAVASTRDKFVDALATMAVTGYGILPVVDEDGNIYGVLTEHDVLRYLAKAVPRGLGIRATEAMSSPVFTVEAKATLAEAMRRMIAMGFRRLPVLEDNEVVGMLTSMDVVRYFGSHRAFEATQSGDIREATSVKVEELMTRDLAYVRDDADLGDAVAKMLERGVSSVLVVGDSMELKGIITERDVIYFLASRPIA
ncbi:MAG: CBS domain-containing protein [Desulfurococcaceae archaeon]